MRSGIIVLCVFVTLAQSRVTGRGREHEEPLPSHCPDGWKRVSESCVEALDTSKVRVAVDRNVVTVPPNCPAGQEYVNGACRDVWQREVPIKAAGAAICAYGQELVAGECRNVVSVPPNCAAGQQYVNGACRDVWRRETTDTQRAADDRNVISVPPNCAAGQEYVNGACRDVWRREIQPSVAAAVICAYGQELVAGECRNVVSVPPNCAAGQQYVNGACRDVWRRDTLDTKGVWVAEEPSLRTDYDNKIDNNKNIVSVPSQCPTGYRPDANGICREIWGQIL